MATFSENINRVINGIRDLRANLKEVGFADTDIDGHSFEYLVDKVLDIDTHVTELNSIYQVIVSNGESVSKSDYSSYASALVRLITNIGSDIIAVYDYLNLTGSDRTVNKVKSVFDEKDTEISGLTSQLSNLESILSDIKTAINDKYTDTDPATDDNKADYDTLISAIQTGISSEELAVYVNNLNDIAIELNKYSGKNYTANTTNYSDYDIYVKKVVDDSEAKSETITSLNGDIADLTEENTGLNSQITTLTGEKTALTTENTGLKSNLSDIASELNKYDDKNYTATTSNYADYDIYVKKVVDDSEAKSGTITTLNSQISGLNDDISDLNTQISGLNDENTGLKSNLSDIAIELNKYDDKNYTAGTTNYADYDIYVKKVVDDSESRKTEIGSLNTQVSSLNSQITTLNGNITTLTGEKNTLNGYLGDIKNAINDKYPNTDPATDNNKADYDILITNIPEPECWALMTDWDTVGSEFTNNSGILYKLDPMGFTVLGDGSSLDTNTVYTVTSLVVRCGWAEGEYPESQKAYKTFNAPTKIKVVIRHDSWTSDQYLYVLKIADSVLPTSLTINSADTITSGGTIPLSFTVSPSKALNYPYFWYATEGDITFNNNTVTVSSSWSPGNSVSIGLDCCGVTATKRIQVVNAPAEPLSAISVSPNYNKVALSGTVGMTATTTPSNYSGNILWNVSDSNLGSVNSNPSNSKSGTYMSFGSEGVNKITATSEGITGTSYIYNSNDTEYTPVADCELRTDNGGLISDNSILNLGNGIYKFNGSLGVQNIYGEINTGYSQSGSSSGTVLTMANKTDFSAVNGKFAIHSIFSSGGLREEFYIVKNTTEATDFRVYKISDTEIMILSKTDTTGGSSDIGGDYTPFEGFTHIGSNWENQSDGIYYAKSYIIYGGSIGNYITEQGGAEISLKTSYDEFNTDYLCVYYGNAPGSGYPGDDTFLIYEGDAIDFKLKKTDESHIEILAKSSSSEPEGDWTLVDDSFVLGGNFGYKGDGIFESLMDISTYSLNSGSNVSMPSAETILDNVNTLKFNNAMQSATKYIELGFDNATVKFKYLTPNENPILGFPGVQIWYKGTAPTPTTLSWLPCEDFDCFGSYWSDNGEGKLNYGYMAGTPIAYKDDVSTSSVSLSRQIINLLENVDSFRVCMDSYKPLDSALYNQLEKTASVIIIPDMSGEQLECLYNYNPMPSGYSPLSTNAISNSEWNYSGLGLWSIPSTYGAIKYQVDGGEITTLTEDTEITASNLMLYGGGDYGFNANKLSYSGAEKTFKIIKITDYACQILYEA